MTYPPTQAASVSGPPVDSDHGVGSLSVVQAGGIDEPLHPPNAPPATEETEGLKGPNMQATATMVGTVSASAAAAPRDPMTPTPAAAIAATSHGACTPMQASIGHGRAVLPQDYLKNQSFSPELQNLMEGAPTLFASIPMKSEMPRKGKKKHSAWKLTPHCRKTPDRSDAPDNTSIDPGADANSVKDINRC